MSAQSFREVAWREVYDALYSVLRLFQLLAAKQVMDIVEMNVNKAQYKDDHGPTCPSCDCDAEIGAHIPHWEGTGRVEPFQGQ